MAQVFISPKKRRASAEALAVFNDLMYGVALFGPILTVPQFIEVLVMRHVDGVSLVTWAAYAVASLLWLAYGIIHKQKPIILSQSLLFVLDVAITAGVLIYRK